MKLGVTCSVGLFALASASEHSGVPNATSPECLTPVRDTCTFYSACLEPLVQCGANGYPLGFGAKYCDKFLENKSDFSDRGQKWEEDVGQCLQDALVPFVNGSKQPDCQDLKEYAIGTHARCYVGTGFCSLGLLDKLKLLRIIGIGEIFKDPSIPKSMITVLRDCIMGKNPQESLGKEL